jgi:hypothetical protein
MGSPAAPTPDPRADRADALVTADADATHPTSGDPTTPAETADATRPDADVDADAAPPSGTDVSERFAAHVGVHIGRDDGSQCGCGATATLTASPTWRSASDARDASDAGGAGATPVPTGALLALVDATAREAAEAAVAVPGLRATLVPMATGVQFRDAAWGTVRASASVPCEGVLVDRADDQGMFRFSVAVDVVGSTGSRVATGTVQWLARVDRDAGGASDVHADNDVGAAPDADTDPAA